MNFQVPQFIEIEDKIFGPLTFKQFVYIAGSLGGAFIFYTYLPRLIAWPLILAIVAFGLLLAFYKVNNQPFIKVTEAAFRYLFTKKLYIWKRKEKTAVGKKIVLGSEGATGFKIPKLSQSRLRDLSWSLDVREKIQ
ncbi:MAG: PrgI family protein [Patescibacteria group bacterium]